MAIYQLRKKMLHAYADGRDADRAPETAAFQGHSIVHRWMERLLLNRLVRNRIESQVAYFKQRLEGV